MFFMNKKVTPPHEQIKKLVWLFLIIGGLCVFSGGCGSSHGSFNSASGINNSWNGGWLAKTNEGSITFSRGQSDTPLTILNFALLLEDSNVEDFDTDGSTTISAVMCLSGDHSGILFRLPLLFDKEKFTTARDKDHEEKWTLKSTHANFTLDFSDSDKSALFSGTVEYSGTTVTFTDIRLNKANESDYPSLEISSALNGTWSVSKEDEDQNGGYIAVNNGTEENSYLLSASAGYANMVFDGTSHITASIAMPVIVANQNGPVNNGGDQGLLPLTISEDIKVEKLFGSVYRLNFPNVQQQTMKGIVIFDSATKATLIVISSNSSNGMTANTMFHINKNTAEDNIATIFTSLNNTSWTANSNVVGGIAYAQSTGLVPLIYTDTDPFKVNIVSIANPDTTAKTADVTINASGTFTYYVIQQGTVTSNTMSIANLIGSLGTANSDGNITVKAKHIGYNTLYAESEHCVFSVIYQSDNNVYVFVRLNGILNNTQILADLAAQMTKN